MMAVMTPTRYLPLLQCTRQGKFRLSRITSRALSTDSVSTVAERNIARRFISICKEVKKRRGERPQPHPLSAKGSLLTLSSTCTSRIPDELANWDKFGRTWSVAR